MNADDREAALALLRWYVEMGADEAIAFEPEDRLSPPPASPPPPAPIPGESPPPRPAPARSGRPPRRADRIYGRGHPIRAPARLQRRQRRGSGSAGSRV